MQHILYSLDLYSEVVDFICLHELTTFGFVSFCVKTKRNRRSDDIIITPIIFEKYNPQNGSTNNDILSVGDKEKCQNCRSMNYFHHSMKLIALVFVLYIFN